MSITQPATSDNSPAGYAERQRQNALAHAPAGPVSEDEFRRELLSYPLPVIRQASVRYSPARGRSYGKVIDYFAASIKNPHVNRGDDFRTALGMVRWINSEKARWGIR